MKKLILSVILTGLLFALPIQAVIPPTTRFQGEVAEPIQSQIIKLQKLIIELQKKLDILLQEKTQQQIKTEKAEEKIEVPTPEIPVPNRLIIPPKIKEEIKPLPKRLKNQNPCGGICVQA